MRRIIMDNLGFAIKICDCCSEHNPIRPTQCQLNATLTIAVEKQFTPIRMTYLSDILTFEMFRVAGTHVRL